MLGWLEGSQRIVRQAENGREALNRLQEDKPDLILLDLMIPEMDGFAVVAAFAKAGGLAGHSGHRHHLARSRRQGPRATEFRGTIRAGEGKVPTGRPGGVHSAPRA